MNVAVSVNLKIPEFLSELFARWDTWPFSIAPGALPCPPLSQGAELLCDPSSVLSFRALYRPSLLPFPSLPFPPLRSSGAVWTVQLHPAQAGLDRSKQSCFH